ncbi:hypothetical protein I3843_14G122200 [Carya illinoinensis]|uniref:Uncharacterized protein n=1 Tax=Carya illinoinensis TaxID=32201 RepID=A0A922D4V0_CARIL|nr:hypothetical protein I3842_14G124700 [Carya illinoinensis]KAG7947984.1 hypothetical protein I3843_14G122200 [Carya illinoinensis]
MDSGEESDDDLGVGDGERSLPEEYRAFYKREVSKSEGFDVPEIIAGYLYNLIQPRDLDDIYEECTQLAIDEYNRRFAETNAKLELVKVSKVMAHLYDKIRYYITFEARDLADGGKTKTYQAVVRDAIPGISVLSFRLKPAEDEQVGSGNHGKEWIWEGHLVNGHLLAGG